MRLLQCIGGSGISTKAVPRYQRAQGKLPGPEVLQIVSPDAFDPVDALALRRSGVGRRRLGVSHNHSLSPFLLSCILPFCWSGWTTGLPGQVQHRLQRLAQRRDCLALHLNKARQAQPAGVGVVAVVVVPLPAPKPLSRDPLAPGGIHL